MRQALCQNQLSFLYCAITEFYRILKKISSVTIPSNSLLASSVVQMHLLVSSVYGLKAKWITNCIKTVNALQ